MTGATFNYGIGQVLPQVLSFLLIPVYTAVLTPGEYGVIDLATALGAFLAPVMRLGVPGAVTRYYYDYKEGPQLRDYVTTVHRFVSVSSVVVGAIALAALARWGGFLVPGLPYAPFVLLVVTGSAAAGNSDLQRRLIQAREQSSYSAKLSMTYAGVGAALGVALVVGLRWGALGMVLASTMSALLFFLQAQWYLRSDVTGSFRPVLLRSSLTYAGGILPSHLMSLGTPLATRAILSGVASVSSVGLYGLATRFTMPLTLMANAFQSAYLPIYFSVRKERSPESLRRLADVANGVWLVAVVGFLGAALLGPVLIELLTPERFHPAAPIVPILAVAFLSRTLYYLFSPEILYSGRTWIFTLLSAVSIAVTLLVTLATVRTWGAYGVAFATVLGSTALAIGAMVVSVQLARLPYDWWGLGRVTLVGAAALCGGLAVAGTGVRLRLLAGVALVLACPAVLWLVRDATIRRAVALVMHPSRRED